MTPDADEQPFVDSDTQRSLADVFRRVLEHATPDSLVSGGASEDTLASERTPRNHEVLTQRRAIYEQGGPVTEFIDTRALMTYGTGAEFVTDDDLMTGPEGRTVDEWLADQFDMLDEHFIQRGVQCYVYGDAWPEIVETRGGDFSHVNLVDPTTVNPEWDRHGEITELTQIVQQGKGRATRQPLDTDMVGHYWFKSGIGGGPLGTSLIEQNKDEIQRFASNQEQRANAIRLHGSPHYHVAVGSDGQSISDRLIRRVRDRFSSTNTDEKTNWVTGGDIEISELDAPGFQGMESITQTDIALLSSGFGLPLEYTNFGSDGLGSGKPAESRQLKFERQARAEQRRAADQFLEQVVRPVLRLYSPFPEDIDVTVEFGDVVSDIQSTAEWMREYKSYMTPDEIRENLGLGTAPEDAELGPPEGTPDAESPGEGMGGLFGGGSSPDASVSMSDATQGPAIGDGGGPAEGNASRALLHSEASDDALTQEELVWSDVYEAVLWADDGDDRQLFEFDPDEVPQFALDRLENAVREGAVFSEFETIPDWAAGEVQDVMLDSLETRHGWSVDSIAQNLRDMALGLSESDARTIARTETASLVNTAREEGYRDQFGDDARYKWVGPTDDRNTDACEWLREQTNPKFGGTPVPIDELKELIQEAPTHDDEMPDDMAREWVVHPNERYTYVRVVE